MRVLSHGCVRFSLPLSRPLATAHGTISRREGIWVRLVDDAGHVGFGEATPLPGFGLETLAETGTALERGAGALGTLPASATLDTALDVVLAETEKAPCARAALDTALHDLAARRAALPLAAFLARDLGRAPRARVAIAALLRADTPRALADETQRAVEAGHRAVKLKLATGAGDDRARVEAVRAACPADVELRLDANAGWSEEEAAHWLAWLAPFRPAFVEQPVASPAAFERLLAFRGVALAVDEGLSTERDADRFAGTRAADVWVVKPAVVGGLRAARRLAARAAGAGADVIVGGFLDTAVGHAAALALAAALPGERPAGLDGVVATGASLPPLVAGGRACPRGPGLGVTPDPRFGSAP